MGGIFVSNKHISNDSTYSFKSRLHMISIKRKIFVKTKSSIMYKSSSFVLCFKRVVLLEGTWVIVPITYQSSRKNRKNHSNGVEYIICQSGDLWLPMLCYLRSCSQLYELRVLFLLLVTDIPVDDRQKFS